MTGDQWRVVKRKFPLIGYVYQFCLIRDGKIIPCGPMGDSIDEMKEIAADLCVATLHPVIEDLDGKDVVKT